MRLSTNNLRGILAALVVATGTVGTVSCSGGGETYLTVTVHRGVVMGDIDKIDLTLSFNGEQATRVLETGGTPLVLPTTAVFQIRNGQGTMTVVAAASASGVEVARGSAMTEIRRGVTNAVPVELGRTTTLDSGLDLPTADAGVDRGVDSGVDTAQLPAALTGPASLPFGSVVVGGASAVQSVVITNGGQQSSGALTINSSSTEFVVQATGAGDCGAGALAGGASCTVRLVFSPSAAGARTGTLSVAGVPGGTVLVSLSGTGLAPGSLTMSQSTLAFGPTPVGTPVAGSLTLNNTGGVAMTDLQIVLEGGGSAQFSRLTGAAGDCGTGLAAASSCTIRLTFTAGVRGTSTATVTAKAGLTAAAANLTGVAQGPAILTADSATLAFGDIEVGGTSTAQSWKVTNTGDLPTTAAPTVVSSVPAEFVTSSACTAVLAAGASCTVTVTFKPTTGGSRSGSITATAGTATTQATASGRGMYRVTLKRVVGATCATCTVVSGEVPAKLSCGSTCTSVSALYAPGDSVTLKATTTNGSGQWFSGWSGADTLCAGPQRTCTFGVSGAAVLTGTFSNLTNNLVFHSSGIEATNAGSAKAYDKVCNVAASAAGINNAAGTGFVAWVSDTASLATARVTVTQGWVRMDGRPFAQTKASLLAGAVLTPARFDENGTPRIASVITGTYEDGSLSTSQHCANWTSILSTDSVLGGSTTGGPGSWTASFGTSCSMDWGHVLCLGNTSSAAVAAQTTTGRKIWVTGTAFTPAAGANPDTFCASHKPATVGSAVALIARTTSSAGAVLTPTQVYVRPDGQRIGTGADIIAGDLETGIWQTESGAYGAIGFRRVWVGASGLSTVGTLASTCGNWVDPTQTSGAYGSAAQASADAFRFGSQACNVTGDKAAALYCVEK